MCHNAKKASGQARSLEKDGDMTVSDHSEGLTISNFSDPINNYFIAKQFPLAVDDGTIGCMGSMTV